jgi:predicted N-acetyltransferase YhbS
MNSLPASPKQGTALSPLPIISIRPEFPEDAAWIEDLQALAFGPGRFARAAFRVREQFPIDPTLSHVAEVDGHPVSSVWMTPISLSGRDGFLLGPLATDPAFRNKGTGKRLVTEVCRIALRRGQGDYVLLVGDEPYYGPLGFRRTRPGAIVFPGPVDPERILVHCADPHAAEELEGAIDAFGAR